MEALTVIKPVEEQVPASVITEIGPYLHKFIIDRDVKDNSRRVYLNNLQQFFTWVNQKGYLLSEISRGHIIEYKAALLQAGKSTLTVSGYLSSIRCFFEWAEGNKIYPNIAKGVRAPKNKKEFRKLPLSIDQTKQLHTYLQQRAYGIDQPEAIHGLNLSEVQNYVIINLILRMGLRCIEVARLNVEDIGYINGNRVMGIRGKGYDGISRTIRVPDSVYKPLQKYLRLRCNPSQGPVFISLSNHDRGTRITTRSISRIAKTALRAIGIDDRAITAHSLRHTMATNAKRSGATTEQIQHDLGHASIDTTQLYTKIMQAEERLNNSAIMLIDNLF